jgi:2,4-dienoyl-CoA reductase-like NADH-dependent reductase (Old Yellow Enzyme family)
VASLRQTETVIDEMEQLLDRLRKELKGDADFSAIVDVADEIAEAADRLASQFNDANQALSGLLDNAIGAVEEAGGELTEALSPRRDDSRSSADRDADQPTKEELLEQARKANITGRSGMTKEELQEAIDAENSPTKEKLLDRAREIDLPGRSEMTKDELQEAVNEYENATKEELLERAKEAGITGRSDMSKEELKKALESRNS